MYLSFIATLLLRVYIYCIAFTKVWLCMINITTAFDFNIPGGLFCHKALFRSYVDTKSKALHTHDVQIPKPTYGHD